MHDIRFIRDNPEQFDAALARRGLPAAALQICDLDTHRRALQTELQENRHGAMRQAGRLDRLKHRVVMLVKSCLRLPY